MNTNGIYMRPHAAMLQYISYPPPLGHSPPTAVGLPLGAHTYQDWPKTSPGKMGTEGAFAYSLVREVFRPATPGALRSTRGHINRPFLRLAAVGAPRGLGGLLPHRREIPRAFPLSLRGSNHRESIYFI